MCSKFLHTLHRISSWRNVILLGTMSLLLIAVILPEAEGNLEELSNGVGRLDNELFYTPDSVHKNIYAYGEAGRELYIFSNLTAGLIATLSYTLFVGLLLILLLTNIRFPHKNKLLFIPLAIFILDMTENIGLSFLLYQFPIEYPLFTRVLALFTFFKWLSIALSLLLVLILGGISIYHYAKELIVDKMEWTKGNLDTKGP